jgi:hypothetical protein
VRPESSPGQPASPKSYGSYLRAIYELHSKILKILIG